MTIPPASLLALYGIGFIAVFGAWKLTVSPLLTRRAAASAT